MPSSNAPKAAAFSSLADMLAKSTHASAIRDAVARGDVAVISAADFSLAAQKQAPPKPR